MYKKKTNTVINISMSIVPIQFWSASPTLSINDYTYTGGNFCVIAFCVSGLGCPQLNDDLQLFSFGC